MNVPKQRLSERVLKLIRERQIARMKREREQIQLIKDSDIHWQTIVNKLDGLWESTQYENLKRCGQEKIYRTCKCCGELEEFSYRCSLKFCPRCQWTISKEREKKIRVWAAHVKQPKHLVLTQRNFPILTRSKLREHLKNLQRFRRTKLFSSVKGGCVSVEITNEGRGWHLHSHWLCDVRFLDIVEISKTWGDITGQEFGICYIKDVRDKSFVQELLKYLVKGSELANWPAEQILEMVTAIRGTRFFFSFGSLFKQGKEIREQLKFMQKPKAKCDCGNTDFIYETELQAVLNELRKAKRKN